MTESNLLRRVWLEMAARGFKLFRNNVGSGKLLHANGTSQYIDFGLYKGSSDLIGWETITVTPEMVGTQIAQFVALEVKTETGRLKPEQKTFLEAVKLAGGQALVSKGGITNTYE
jgi:hypothetical protein